VDEIWFGVWLPVPVADAVVKAAVSEPVAAAVAACDAVDPRVVDVVVKFAFTAARFRSCVLLEEYLSVPHHLKLTQVSPCELSLSAMQSSVLSSLTQRVCPSLVILPLGLQV
jgi:hypothetical protein